MFYAFYNNIQSFHEQVKFYCYCEDEEIHDILEDYYNGLKDKPDLELFSINELRVRKVYEEVPLHSYYFDKKHGMVKDVLVEDWNLHMVVVGLGKLGQRMILQAMTQGVVHSKSDMIFDVIDCNIEEQKEIFANHFSSLCMDMSKENEWQLGSPHADGRLIIRFHNMDARRKSFQSLLMDIGKDLPPTYIAVCITDEKNSLHCMLEVEKYLHRQGLVHVPVGVRMENDVRMSEFLISNNQKHKNVFVIEDIKNAISLDDMLSQSLNCAAKNNHYLYKKLNMVCNPQHEMVVEDVEYISNKLMLTESEMETGWRALPLFKRDSNRASSLHLNVKRDILDAYKGIEKDRDVFFEELWDKYFGKNGKIRKQGTQWVFKGTNEELNQYITKDVLLNEMAMMEHRRWCYFMASIGWKSKYEQSIREEESKIHPCLVDWKELLTNEELCENCKYDLQSLLFILNQWKEQKEMQKQ